MALLLLWEVDHDMQFPGQGGTDRKARLVAFTKRLKSRVAQDPELRSWLTCSSTQRSAMPGLPGVHQSWWSVKIVAPTASEDQTWYAEFVRRWQEYATTVLATSGRSSAGSQPSSTQPSPPAPAPSPPSSPTSGVAPRSGAAARRRSAANVAGSSKRPRTTPPQPSVPEALAGAPLEPAPVVVPSSVTTREPAAPTSPRPAKRQRTLQSWLRPPTGPPPVRADPSLASSSTSVFLPPGGEPAGHGRAMQGPPT